MEIQWNDSTEVLHCSCVELESICWEVPVKRTPGGASDPFYNFLNFQPVIWQLIHFLSSILSHIPTGSSDSHQPQKVALTPAPLRKYLLCVSLSHPVCPFWCPLSSLFLPRWCFFLQNSSYFSHRTSHRKPEKPEQCASWVIYRELKRLSAGLLSLI